MSLRAPPRHLPWILVLAASLLAAGGVRAEEPSAPASRLLEPLRAEHAKTTELVSEVRVFVNSGTTDREAIRTLGDRIHDRLGSIRDLIARYEAATTRFGLQAEYDLVADLVTQAGFLTKAYGRLTGVPPRPPTAQEQEAARAKAREYLGKVLRPVVAQRLGSQGLAELLTAESFSEAVRVAEGEVSERVLAHVNEDIRLLAETGLAGGSLESYVRASGRRLVARYVGMLLAKVTTNALVIDFVAGSIVRWVGARLKRALRPKGNLDARTKRSVEVLDEARDNLNELDGRGAMLVVRMALENARAALASTKYLVGDLQRAGRTDLQDELKDALDRLRRTIRLTEHRFLVDSKLASEDLQALIKLIDDLREQVREMQAGMRPGEREPLIPPDAPAERDAVAGTYEVYKQRELDTGEHYDETKRLVLVGNLQAVEFEYTNRWGGEVRWHWKGRLEWVGGQAGPRRTLRGPGVDQKSPSGRQEPVTVVLEKGDDGAWKATRFDLGGNAYVLVKERRGAPR